MTEAVVVAGMEELTSLVTAILVALCIIFVQLNVIIFSMGDRK